jgi:K+-sensing histidine kinase KdpD
MTEIVKEATAQTKKIRQEKSAKVRQQLEEATVYGNQESLLRLIVILLDNAVKYGPQSGTIYLAGARRGAFYVLTVRDEGKGVADKDVPYIFDRLYRGDQSRTATVSGYGLGLSLAREIIQANQGSIKAYNAAQGGAVFSVQLPLARTK